MPKIVKVTSNTTTVQIEIAVESEKEKAFNWLLNETSSASKLQDGLWYVVSSKFDFPLMWASENLLLAIGKVMALEAEIDALDSEIENQDIQF